MSRIRKHLSYANVMATIAVFIALGGGAYAAFKIPKNSVGTSQLKKKAVSNSRIRSGAVTSSKIAKTTIASLRGQKGPQGAAGPTGPAPASAWATVNADGSLVAGSNSRVASGPGAPGGGVGSYSVDFPMGITLARCAVSATINNSSSGGIDPTTNGFAVVNTGGGIRASVQTYNNSGAATALPFSLAVYC